MKQLDPKAVWLFFLGSIWRWLAGLFFLSLWVVLVASDVAEDLSTESGEETLGGIPSWSWLVLIGFIIFAYAWARLTYHFYRYELTDAGFRKEEGVIYKKYTTIPYDRIQNVDIYRGILARILGLSDLKIQTAGTSATFSRYGASGTGAEGRIPGLSKEVAEQVRDELIQRARQPRNSGI